MKTFTLMAVVLTAAIQTQTQTARPIPKEEQENKMREEAARAAAVVARTPEEWRRIRERERAAAEAAAKQAREQKELAEKRAQEAKRALKKIAEDRNASAQQRKVAKAKFEGKITIGMTAEEVRQAWGPPDRINRTVTSRYKHEQWVYGKTYIYIDDGVMTAYQDSK